MCVAEGLDFGKRRQNGRPSGRLKGCWGFPARGDRGPSGRRRRTKAERARIAAESMVPGVRLADVARKHGTTRWQIYDWRKRIRRGDLVLPEAVAGLPAFAELVVEVPANDASTSGSVHDLEIVVGDVVIRAGTDAGEGHLTRAIRAARAAAS